MKNWQNISALKSVKSEVESLSGALASSLEAVITTPVDEHKDIHPLRGSTQDFSRVSGTLELLDCPQQALLAREIHQLMENTLALAGTLDNTELEKRLQLAFAAVTDLPALLEHALASAEDDFVFVSQHVNRLRKARGCAIVFSSAPLLEKADTDFRMRFRQQPDKMLDLLARQAVLYVRCATALHKNPADEKARQALASVLGNLELVLRDYRIGVLWGLGRALVEACEAGGTAQVAALVPSLLSLVPVARRMLGRQAALLEEGVDELLLEKLVNALGGITASSGRPHIVKLCYSLDFAGNREFRKRYRRVQVSFYNKGALDNCLNLIRSSIGQIIDTINDQVENNTASVASVDKIHADIHALASVLRVLRMDHVADQAEQALAGEHEDKLDDALSRAAGLLFRMNKAVSSKLDSMEREVFSSERGISEADSLNSGKLQILKTAKATLEGVTLELDNYVDQVRALAQNAPGREQLAAIQRSMDEVSCVLNTLPMPELARALGTGRDFAGWALSQTRAPEIDERFLALSYLLINGISYIEQLIMGRDDHVGGTLEQARQYAAELDAFLATLPPTEPVPEPAVEAAVVGLHVVPAPGAELPVMEAAPEPPAPEEATRTEVPVLTSMLETSGIPVLTALAEPAAETAHPEVEKVDEALLAIFLEEADDLLQSLDSLFLHWREHPADKAGVPEFLRLLHTMKGSAALVCEHELSKAAHDYETFLLETQRNNSPLDAGFFAECDRRLLAMQDIRRLYDRDESGHITRARGPVTAPETTPSGPAAPEAVVTETAVPAPVESAATPTEATTETGASTQPSRSAAQDEAPDEQLRVSSKLLRSLLNDADEINFSRSRIEAAFQDIGTLLGDMDEILERLLGYVKSFGQTAGERRGSINAYNIESKAEYAEEFDSLEMDRYTELHQLALSMTEDYNDLQDVRHNISGKVKEIDSILNQQQRLTNSLQDGLISSQMVPFASVVPRLGRLVRQVSGTLGKPVRVDVQDQQGLLDGNVLQAIITPLEHIIRNAIDHGIELPDERSASGKPAEAALTIAAGRQAASFVIRISDDGRGIDVDKVAQLAKSKGLLPGDATLRDEDAYQLLFRPGFSTSASVSSISGRGVGLDVVRSEIENIGGTVGIESARGQGSTFVITLPLTSSLNRALLFELHNTRYVVLMNTLDGVLNQRAASLQEQEGTPCFDYGGKRYEYLYAGKLINEDFQPRLEGPDSLLPLLLISGAERNHALHVDAIVESRDLVVKSIGQQFAGIPGIAGGVIMPDGNVAIVLDLKTLAHQYRREPSPLQFDGTVTPAVSYQGSQRNRKLVMVVDDSITVRKVTSAMLERNGMDAVTAKNGLEAVDLLEHTLPDVILLDIEMPKMDGFEFATHVRAQPRPVCDIPIIMITSRIGDKHRARAEAIGVNRYLCKPFEESSLLEYIRSYLNSRMN